MKGRSRERAIFAPLLLIGAGFASSTVVTPLYPLYQTKFGFSSVTLTIIYAAYVIGNLLALMTLGRLSDSIGRRPVGIAAAALCGTAVFLFIVASGPAVLLAGRLVSGIGVGLASGTGAAWLVDLHQADRSAASFLATEANMIGIGLAPLVAGLLASLAPRPLLIPFLAYLLVIALALGALSLAADTVARRRLPRDWFVPRIALPRGSRTAFIAPAVTAFAAFAFAGFYASLLPAFLRDAMGIREPAGSGAVIAGLFAAAAVTLALARRLSARTSMLASAAAIAPALIMLVLAQDHRNLMLLLAATVIGGAALALAYRGGLEVVSAIAPQEDRAGLISLYLIACFAGNSVPLIGIALAERKWGSVTAAEIFAAVMLLLAAIAFVAGLMTGHRQPRERRPTPIFE